MHKTKANENSSSLSPEWSKYAEEYQNNMDMCNMDMRNMNNMDMHKDPNTEEYQNNTVSQISGKI